jgi:hypothetical protein
VRRLAVRSPRIRRPSAYKTNARSPRAARDQAVGLEFGSDEFDQQRNVAGQLEEMLLVQVSMASAADAAERRAALNVALPNAGVRFWRSAAFN